MKKFLFILCSLVVISKLTAQNSDYTDISALLENKIWNVQLPKGKQYAMKMEFRDAGWKKTFYMMRRKQKHFILILYVEIQSRFLSQGKSISFKN